MKTITLTSDEATRVLHALRNVHMNLGTLEKHVPEGKRDDCLLLSGEFQGELYALTTIVEAALWENGALGVAPDGEPGDEDDDGEDRFEEMMG